MMFEFTIPITVRPHYTTFEPTETERIEIIQSAREAERMGLIVHVQAPDATIALQRLQRRLEHLIDL